MGPTNVALVKLFQADQHLRAARERLDAAAKNVRVQERRVNDTAAKLKAAQQHHREQQARAGSLDLDLRSRDAHIEKLRTQQQSAKNNKEYQAFLIEINTAKVDKAKVEDEAMRSMEQVDKAGAEAAALATQLEGEKVRLTELSAQIGETLKTLQAEVDALVPAREEAAAALPPKILAEFDRLAARFDGEPMSALAKPDRRREEYLCTACNMDLVTDVYNKLHSRDELVYCPSCRRLLYIPEDLPPEAAIGGGRGVTKSAGSKAPPKRVTRASSMSFEQALDKFRRWFAEGFNDQCYRENERDYKLEAGSRYRTLLGNGRGESMLAGGDVGGLVGAVRQVLTGGSVKLNLLEGRFETAPLLDALTLAEGESQDLTGRFFNALFALLARPEPDHAAFNGYTDAVAALPQRGSAPVFTWPVVTVLPFLVHPGQHMFLKPEITKDAAASVGFELGYEPRPNWETYQRLLQLGRILQDRLAPAGARDFVDVQSFMYVVWKYPATPGAARATKGKSAGDERPASSEPRAKGKLGQVLAKAQGESVSRAAAADHKPLEFEVYVDGALAGVYKGNAAENLERAIRYYMGEAKLAGEVRVVRPAASAAEPAPESAAVPPPSSPDSDLASAVPTESVGDDPEQQPAQADASTSA